MIYFDQAATSFQKPPEVSAAVQRAFLNCASVGRGGHDPSMEASKAAFNTRCLASEIFDTEPDQVVFTYHATHGLNIAIRSLVHAGDTVVISGFEHNAVLRPLYEIGANIIVAGEKLFQPDDTINAFSAVIHSGIKAVICTHISNVFGYVLPVEEIAEMCKHHHVPLILDASQSAGVLPVSLKELGAAFIAMPGHKGLYGPQGTGILLCGQIPKPLICGGTGSDSLNPYMPTYLPDAAEAGTHNIHGLSGLYEGLRFIQRTGNSAILTHERMLLEYFCEKMMAMPGVQLYHASSDCQSGVISFTFNHMDCETLAKNLGDADVAVRAGLQCSPLAHRSCGTLDCGTVRVSFSYYNTVAEINQFSEILHDIVTS